MRTRQSPYEIVEDCSEKGAVKKTTSQNLWSRIILVINESIKTARSAVLKKPVKQDALLSSERVFPGVFCDVFGC